MTTIEDVRRVTILEEIASHIPDEVRPLVQCHVFTDRLQVWHMVKGDPDAVGSEVAALLDRYPPLKFNTVVETYRIHNGVGGALVRRQELELFETDGKTPWRDREDRQEDLYSVGYK